MPSKPEQIIQKLEYLLVNYCAAKVERNAVLPERIPPNGLIIIRDGDPGEADSVLGGFDSVYYTHSIPLEIYIEEARGGQRDSKFDDLIIAIGNILNTYPDLEGLAFGLIYNWPQVTVEPVLGGPAIKSGTLNIIAEYEASNPLA